ncbi:TreTu family toxin [Paractinoplanes hotanensis]|uniref:Polymorphic toxin-type HINT domain-containing protein n=1 Tax=Paractinoplanes hotanensis TaxID=2906497 RepID=A0ABT0Y8V8_9ACTN|nr:polymorphic toxin-type HINT domain-containing protein [Actinoplanes hotanensis]MCM4082476.1 polymorphic toxin-type HINT domain-containing protein [Actinoplanes hotanensis]
MGTGLVLALAVQLAGAGVQPAFADVPEFTVDELREAAASDVQSGGPSVKRAAEAALVGSEQDLRAYSDSGFTSARTADERLAAQALAGTDGPSLTAAALASLDKSPAELRTFVDGGWRAAWNADERVRAFRILDAGGPTVQAAAQRAVNGSAADLNEFMSTGRRAAEHADDRLAATRMLTGAANNSGALLNEAAQKALTGTPEELAEFLRWGQYVARARDAELASIRSLTEQAKQAGAATAREALAAEESSTQAGNAAAEAKAAANAAVAEAKAAGGDAKKASAAAGRAADAADGAAAAAREAVKASNAAMRAARTAADAARKATAAASLTAQAATRAQRAATAARLNAGDARLAREAAEAARDAAALAQQLEQVKAQRDRAQAQALASAVAAGKAGANADEAANAADEASSQSGVSAQQAQRARNAAAQARAAAKTADRAADRAESLARQAQQASDEAFALAQSAAQHASTAVTQANAAADAADRAEYSAIEAAKHAKAADAAAQTAVAAANQATKLEALARLDDETRLAEWTEQGVAAAQAAVQAEQETTAAGGEIAVWNRSLLWDTAEQDRIDAATRTLLAEATAPGADPVVVLERGRRVALALTYTGGDWTRQAAQDALSGTDADLREWLATGRRSAAGQDDRARVWRLVDTLPDGAEKTAARTALNGDVAVVEQFLRTRNYPGKTVKDRQAAYALLPTASANLKAATSRALEGTGAELHQFLRTGQYAARAADDRFTATGLLEGGPEVRAAAKVALAGTASQLSFFVTTGQYEAQQRDLEQAAHVATVKKLLAEATQYAQKALEDAGRAVEAAERAQQHTKEADAAKARADKAAADATAFAKQAAASADAAKKSAEDAARSAQTARNAANSAAASASQAARSAATATAASRRAAADAATAQAAKRDARASAEAAGKDAEAAAKAATEADVIYTNRVKQAELDRRSTEPGSGPGGQGTAADDHKTWGCLSLEASSASRECLDVLTDFADKMLHQERCKSPANAASAGCTMLGDVKEFIGENGELLLDLLQLTLMACGLVPAAGEVCDGIDAAVSFSRGDWVGGLLSAGAAVPLVGYLATGAKAWKNSDKIRDVLKLVEKLKLKRGKCPALAPRNSFVAGTKVLLRDGDSDDDTRNIEDVTPGATSVEATDPLGNRTAVKPVTALITGQGIKHLVDISIDEDADPTTTPAVITATDEHPFWVPARNAWLPAKELAAGTELQAFGGKPVSVTAVDPRTETTTVYNLTVADIHTYYVMAGKVPVLVHNDEEIVRVGRWMSQEEYDKIKNTGKVQPGHGSGMSYVVYPADKEAYRSSRPGSVYAEFDVPKSSLIPGGRPGDYKMADSTTVFSRLAVKRGGLPLELPDAGNLEIC